MLTTSLMAYLNETNITYYGDFTEQPPDLFMDYADTNWTTGSGGPMDSLAPFGPPQPPQDILLLQSVVRGLQLYVAPVLGVCGLLGNVLCLLCLCLSSSCTPSSQRCFTTALLAAETLHLTVVLHHWSTEMGADLYSVTGWCHLMTFVRDGSKFLSTWYLVCLLVHCLLANCFPDRSDDCCSPCRHLTVTLTLAILALVVFLNISLAATLFYVGDRPVCVYIREPESAMLYLDQVDAFVNVLLPLVVCCIVGTCLGLVRCCCVDRSSSRHLLHEGQLVGHRYILIHTLFCMPFQIAHVHNIVSMMSSGLPHASLKGFLWEEIFKFVCYTNMASTLPVLLATNSFFRKELREILTRTLWKLCCRCGFCPNSISGNTNYVGCSSSSKQTSLGESNRRQTEIC